jgi:hypothetical protein
VQRQCRWLEYLKCNKVKIKIITIVQYETINHSFKEGRFRQGFPPNEQIRMIKKLLYLWWKMQFNLKCRCMRHEQLSIRFLSCEVLRCVGWQFFYRRFGTTLFVPSSRCKHSRKNLGLLDPWNRTKKLVPKPQ